MTTTPVDSTTSSGEATAVNPVVVSLQAAINSIVSSCLDASKLSELVAVASRITTNGNIAKDPSRLRRLKKDVPPSLKVALYPYTNKVLGEINSATPQEVYDKLTAEKCPALTRDADLNLRTIKRLLSQNTTRYHNNGDGTYSLT